MNEMPWLLILAWVGLFGFLNSHQRHIASFNGNSKGILAALNLSFMLGMLVALGLFVYYFLQVSWYWPIVLFLIGSIVGGILFGALDSLIGGLTTSMMAFVGWPICAFCFFYTVRGLAS